MSEYGRDADFTWQRMLERLGSEQQTWGNGYDEAFAPLLTAASKTELRQMVPFTSVDRLCFSRGGLGTPAESVFLSFDPRRPYGVWEGDPFDECQLVAEVPDPEQAVAELVSRLGLS